MVIFHAIALHLEILRVPSSAEQISLRAARCFHLSILLFSVLLIDLEPLALRRVPPHPWLLCLRLEPLSCTFLFPPVCPINSYKPVHVHQYDHPLIEPFFMSFFERSALPCFSSPVTSPAPFLGACGLHTGSCFSLILFVRDVSTDLRASWH